MVSTGPTAMGRIPADVATPTRLWRLRCGTRRRTAAGGVQAEKQQRYVQLIAAGRHQQRGVPAGRDQPQDGEPVAVRAEGSEFRRGACHLSAGEDHRTEAAESAVSLRAGTDPDRRSAGGGDERPRDRGAAGACAVDDQPRDPAQQRPGRPLPSPSRRAGRPAAGGQAAQAPDRCATGCWPRSSSGCWRSAGARSRSRTSCGCCSPVSRRAGCARRRSIRRSTTRRRADAPGAAPATPPAAAGLAAPRAADGDADDRRAPGRGRRTAFRPVTGRAI